MDQNIIGVFNQLMTTGAIIAGTVCAFYLMWGGYVYMTAGGSPREMESGRAHLRNAFFGLGIVLLAGILANLVGNALGHGFQAVQTR